MALVLKAVLKMGTDAANKSVQKLTGHVQGLSKQTAVSNKKSVLSWQKIGASIALVSGLASGFMAAMITHSPALSGALAEISFMLAEVSAELGDTLVPIMDNYVLPVFEKLTNFLINLPSPIKQWIALTIATTAVIGVLAVAVGVLTVVSLPLVASILLIAAAIAGLIYVILNWDSVMSSSATGIASTSDWLKVHLETVLGKELTEAMFRWLDTWAKMWKAKFDFIVKVVKIAIDFLTGYFQLMFKMWKALAKGDLSAVAAIFVEYLQLINKTVEALIGAVSVYFRDVFVLLGSWLVALPGTVIGAFKEMVEGSIAWLVNLHNSFKELIFEGIPAGFTTMFNDLKGKLTGGASLFEDFIKNIDTFFTGAIVAAFNWGVEMIKAIYDGLKEGLEWVASISKEIADAIAGFLGFSQPPPYGPLSNIKDWGVHGSELLADSWGKGIKMNLEPQLNKALPQTALSSPIGSPVGSFSTSQTINITIRDPVVREERDIRKIADEVQKVIMRNYQTNARGV